MTLRSCTLLVIATAAAACAPASPDSVAASDDALRSGDTIIARTEGDFPGWMTIDDDTIYAHLFQDRGTDVVRGNRPDDSKVTAFPLGGGASSAVWQGTGVVIWRITSDADSLYFSARREADGEGLVYKLAKRGGTAKLLKTTAASRFGPGNVHFRATTEYLVVRSGDEPCLVMNKEMTRVVRSIEPHEFLTHDDTQVYLATERNGTYGIYAEPLAGGTATLVSADLERPRARLDSSERPGFVLSEERLVARGGDSLYALAADEPGRNKFVAKIELETGALSRLPYSAASSRGERDHYLLASDTHVCLQSALDILRCQDVAGGAATKVAAPIYGQAVLRGRDVHYARRDETRDDRWIYVRTKL